MTWCTKDSRLPSKTKTKWTFQVSNKSLSRPDPWKQGTFQVSNKSLTRPDPKKTEGTLPVPVPINNVQTCWKSIWQCEEAPSLKKARTTKNLPFEKKEINENKNKINWASIKILKTKNLLKTWCYRKGHGPVLLPRKKEIASWLELVTEENKSRGGLKKKGDPTTLSLAPRKRKEDQIELFSDFSFNDKNGFVC